MSWKSDEVELCNGCDEEVRRVGEDGISVCEGCGVVEGYTRFVEMLPEFVVCGNPSESPIAGVRE